MKLTKRIAAALTLAGIFLTAAAMASMADSPVILLGGSQDTENEKSGPGAAIDMQEDEDWEDLSQPVCVWGPVLEITDSSILIDNQSGNSAPGEMVLHTGSAESKIVDAADGYPVYLDEIQEGDIVYAYIGQAMTMSLPPQVSAELVICKIPEDIRVPSYIHVASVEEQESGTVKLTAADGAVYTVSEDSVLLPYLTKNIVTVQDIREGSRCLIWSDDHGKVEKLVLFALFADDGML